MSIEFATIKGWEIPEGKVVQVADAIGRIMWIAVQKVKVTITSQWLGMDGDTASITVNSSMPFAPDPSNPSYKVTSWTVSVADEPNCTIEIPVGSTIECAVSRDKGNADSYIKLNGSKVVKGDGTYIYTVTRDVAITIEDKYSQGDYGMITIVETGAVIAKPIILQVEKYIGNTYAGETTYENEEFILLDIYPKTNGTVTVTYGGLTKTITDTSGAEEPNAQQVVFGTFNGVTHDTTPASGELTIEGDYYAFATSAYQYNLKSTSITHCNCITAITDMGNVKLIPYEAFQGNLKLISVTIPDSVVSIGNSAFSMTSLPNVVIPNSVKIIGKAAFALNTELKTVEMLAVTPPTLTPNVKDDGTVYYTIFGNINENNSVFVEKIIVPKGCGNAYKTAEGWSTYADYIVEAS